MPARKRLKTYPAESHRVVGHRNLPYSHSQRVVLLEPSTTEDSGQQRVVLLEPSTTEDSGQRVVLLEPSTTEDSGQQRVVLLEPSTAEDSGPSGQERRVSQARGSRKRPRSSRSSTTVCARSSSSRQSCGVSSKRKRDSTTDSLTSPSFEPLDDDDDDDDVSVLSPSKKTCAETPEGTFTFKYCVGEQLGSGGYGSVYAGTRKSDGAEVAIKYILKSKSPKYITMPADGRQLPLEVALMALVSQPEQCPNIIKLLDWYDCAKFFILVLERPMACVDLFDFSLMSGGQLSETDAKKIMRQLVHALIHCRDRGVFHRDVKKENILVNILDYTVKLIDFGCGDLLKENYTTFSGTKRFIPPEWFLHKRYRASPATTWSLGVLLFELVCGAVAFQNTDDITSRQPQFDEGLSEECKELISWCLRKEADERPTLEGILVHQWMANDLP